MSAHLIDRTARLSSFIEGDLEDAKTSMGYVVGGLTDPQEIQEADTALQHLNNLSRLRKLREASS